MEPITPDQRQAQGQAGKEDLIQYVEELRSREEYPEGDAWISITDSARITRTSEAMARRWVTSGRLPIKQGTFGIPPRTRLVRLSDVAKIRPIVDPTAAVSDETRKLDLASIPRQQQQIMQDYQRILAETAILKFTVEQSTSETRASLREGLEELEKRTVARQDHLTSVLEQQLVELRQQLTGQLERLTTELSTLQRQLQEAHEELAASLTAQDQAQQARLQEATAHLDTEQQAQDHKLEETSTALEQAKGTIGQVQRDLQQAAKDLQTAIDGAYQKATREATTLIEQTARDLRSDLTTLESDQAKDVAMLTSQIESMSRKLEQLSAAITAAKHTAEERAQHSHAQESRIDELVLQLEVEREARRMLTQQVQVLLQHVNTPHTQEGSERRRRK